MDRRPAKWPPCWPRAGEVRGEPGRFECSLLVSFEPEARLTYLMTERGMDAREAVRYLMARGLEA